MTDIDVYQNEKVSEETYWRSIILFGANVASYKFALAESLIELIPKGRSTITLEELAEPYTKYICMHLAKSPKQTTSNSSKFLETCSKFNKGMTSKDELITTFTTNRRPTKGSRPVRARELKHDVVDSRRRARRSRPVRARELKPHGARPG